MHRLMRSPTGDRPGRHLTRGLLVAALVAAGISATGSNASAAAVPVELCAVPGTIDLPGQAGVPIWGFGTPTTPGDCSTATASLPGPVIDVNVGDVVTVHVINALPAGSGALIFEAPGIDFDAGATDAVVGGAVTRTFTAGAPGTYLYQSSGAAGRQTAMGLYGALVVRPAPNQAYGASTHFDVEKVLVLSALDPVFNADPLNADLTTYLPTYWMINGKSYPQTMSDGIQASPGQTLLLRYVNAGFDNTSMELLGLHEHVLARDAHLLPQAFDAAVETIPSGGTEDALVTMPATAPPVGNGFALFNRQLHLTNGPTTGPPDFPAAPTPAPGGMLTFIHP
jgi:FtsP/CotA-like multicopper oxidase with cupredoxin domain